MLKNGHNYIMHAHFARQKDNLINITCFTVKQFSIRDNDNLL